MAMPTLEEIRQLPDFAVTSRWEIDITMPDGLSGKFDTNIIKIRASEITNEPKLTNEGQMINIRTNEIFQPTSTKYTHECTVKLVETDDYQVADFCKAWLELCQDPQTKKSSLRKDTQATVIITKLNRQNEPVRRYSLVGVWLKDYSGIAEFTSDEKLIEPTLTFNYDYFKEEKA